MCWEEWLHNRQDQEEELPGLSLPQVSDGWHEPGRYILTTRITPNCVPLIWFNCSCLLFTFFLHQFKNFLSCSSLFLICSTQNQKVEPLKGQPAEQPARADHSSTDGGSLPSAQVHASTRPNDVVPAEGHWAGHHLRRLRQHPAWHLHSPDDHPQQVGRPAGHLSCQVGQGSARLVVYPARRSVNVS